MVVVGWRLRVEWGREAASATERRRQIGSRLMSGGAGQLSASEVSLVVRVADAA